MDAGSTQQIQEAQVADILGSDPAHLETLISHLMSSSNEQRPQAEVLFNNCKETNPGLLSLKLAHFLGFSPHFKGREMAAILLRLLFTSDDPYLWRRLSPYTQSSLKSLLLSSLQRESTQSITEKVCATISELAPAIVLTNGWPELIPLMFKYVQSDSPKLQESALLILAELCQCIESALIPLHTVFSHILGSSPYPEVKIAAVISFVKCLSRPGAWNVFEDLLPAMITALTEAWSNGNEATAQEAMKLLIELARSELPFLRRLLEDVVRSMLQVAEAESLEEGTEHLVLKFLITLAETREGALAMTQFITRLFEILMRMLLDIEDNPDSHTAETEDEDAGETSNYCVGQECLYRLAISLGGSTIFPVASAQFKSDLADSEWQMRHAALIALAKIAKGCSEVMITKLKKVVKMVLNSLYDPHPRVRWAALNAIVQLSTDLYPHSHIERLGPPEQAFAMDDFQIPWIPAHFASAALNFIDNCIGETHYPLLIRVATTNLQKGNPMVDVRALTVLVLEACCEENPDRILLEAARGLGVCAEIGRSVFTPFVRVACSTLIAVMRHRDAPNNVVSALGKICCFHRESVDSAQVREWLDCLPMEGDLIEAKVVHELLCSMVEKSYRELLDPNDELLPKILAVFIQVLYGKDLATEETSGRMLGLLRQFRQTLGTTNVDSMLSSIDAWRLDHFKNILNDG